MNSEFRRLLIEIVEKQIGDQDTAAVLLSGGIDSLSCAFALEEIGVNPVGYTFFVDGKGSEDVRAARKAADLFGWSHTVVMIPTDTLEADFLRLARDYDCQKKTHFEVTWPFLYLYPEIEEDTVLNGLFADVHCGLSKKAMMHYRDTLDSLNEYRKGYFQSRSPSGIRQQEKLADEHDLNFVAPYADEEVKRYWREYRWEEINKPNQKQMIMQAFPERYKQFGWRAPKNLQIEGGVDDVFERLLDSDLNKNGRSRVMDLCHDYGKYNNLS